MKNWQFRKTLIVSVLVHSALLMATIFLPELFRPLKSEIVEITFNPPPESTQPVQKVPEKEKRQIVEQDEKPINDEISEKAKFLSAHNQVVKKQTIASNLGEFRNRKDKSLSQGNGGKPIKVEDLKPKMDFTKILEKKKIQEQVFERTLEENALKVREAKEENFKTASPQNQKPGTGGADISQTTDHVKDLEKGMETLLSTREFVYYSFYARIRRQLNQHWGGKVREKMTKIVKEGRSIASSDDKITKLLITLNRKGQLVKVQVLSDSGVRDLDDAAIEAFQEAAPFPNPPAGIVETDGTIKIRWDFILEA